MNFPNGFGLVGKTFVAAFGSHKNNLGDLVVGYFSWRSSTLNTTLK
jgi:hypothetical protein